MAEPEGSCTITPNPMRETTTQCSSPSFVKIIRSFNMHRGSLELPATFVKEHELNFQKVLKLQGPSGQTTSVDVRVRSRGQDRMYFGGAAWKAFVVENGFKVGHLLVFSLVSMSTFTVGLLKNSASPAHANKHSASVEQRFNIPNSSPRTEMRSSTRPSGNAKNEVIYANGTWKYKPDVEALLENFQCPHFVTVVRRSNLQDNRSSALYVPVKFLEKYGKYFTEFHFLRGPSGGSVEVRFSPGTTKVARFTTGWKTFHKENGIRLGDVLLFSLKAPARWLVQVVENGRSEDPGIGELCNRSDLD